MKKAEQNSLTYYLEPGSGPFHLEVIYEGGKDVEGDPPSFLILSASDPLSRVIKGRVVTDAGAQVKDVLLLMQRDEYGFTDDQFCPITNPDVERAWQQTFLAYLKDGKEDFLLLSRQMTTAGALARMTSLFFCNKTGLFFSPPCPTCGLPLEQCEDDELLVLAGLRPYAASLRRYLYCETCSSQGKFRFYAYETDGLNPAGVENRFDLIKRFVSLACSFDENGDFLCRSCELRDECYGPEQKALSRVVPFGFYPFYMLIVSGPSLNIWNREEREGKEDLLAAREHALRLGWSLITSLGAGQNEPLATAAVPERLAALRDGLEETALSTDLCAPPQDSVTVSDEAIQDAISEKPVANDDIRRLLSEIGRDWRNRPEETMPRPADNQWDDDMEESVETVFLTIGDLEQGASPYTHIKEDEALETVMQSPVRAERLDDMDKTVILSVAPAEKEIDIEKTMILSAAQGVEAAPSSTAAPEPGARKEMARKDLQGDVEETVILSADYLSGSASGAAGTGMGPEAGNIQGEPPKQPAKKSEDDLIEATVILKLDDRPKTKGNR
jgi:hypothetical protein